jgi:hypothetical protein
MLTTTRKRQTAFRFRDDLLDKLRMAAARENRSLNNYVESVLMDVIYNQPNAETEAAIAESRSGKSAGKIDTSSMEAFKKSMGL